MRVNPALTLAGSQSWPSKHGTCGRPPAMKIDGPASLRSGAPRRARQGDTAGGDFSSHFPTGSARGNPSVSAPTHLASVETLIALQGMPDATSRPAAAESDRAEDLLARLDQIRVGLPIGRAHG